MFGLAHEGDGERDGARGERDVEKEDRAPAEDVDQPAAQCGSDSGGNRTRR